MLNDTAGRPALGIAASSPGTWGNALTLEIGMESGAIAISLPGETTTRYATVSSTAGFEQSGLVRIEQIGKPPDYRVISRSG